MTSIHCPVGGLYPLFEPFQSYAICSLHHCPCLLTDLYVRSVSWDPVSHQSPPWPLLYWRRASPPTLSGNLITHSLTGDMHPDTLKDWFTQTHAMGVKFHRCSKHWNLSDGKYGTERLRCNSLQRPCFHFCLRNCWRNLMASFSLWFASKNLKWRTSPSKSWKFICEDVCLYSVVDSKK